MARTALFLTVDTNKAATYENHCNKWLADANEAAERGNHEKAERCYEKSQYWLDKANKARGWGE